MSNFVFNNPAFKEKDPRAVATYPGGPQAGAQGAAQCGAEGGAKGALHACLDHVHAPKEQGDIAREIKQRDES